MARFADIFRRNDFQFGEESEAAFSEDGVSMMSASDLTPHAMAFVQICYDDDWIRSDIDWPEWMDGDEAETLLGNPASIANSSINQLEHILTALVRCDRFNDGTLESAFRRGILAAVVVRCAELAVEQS
ncbi:hypothetical protein A9D14_18285 (plasmid) [Croceicoccus marinus]|uniref:Uncharacterized protein n=2 Tax=Croceicoccus marinus TaxID=450378 RepID=A0A1Z1FHL3_9SPHN|nr:hypothetical protein A9D14_18285 [Croceicoccus marinus]